MPSGVFNGKCSNILLDAFGSFKGLLFPFISILSLAIILSGNARFMNAIFC